MIALIQRVCQAQVHVDNNLVARIDQGLLVFIGVEKTDNEETAQQLLQRVLNYRIFSDNHDKMNLSVQDIQGGVLLVPQFTLAANTSKGLRPSFTPAAPAKQAEPLFNYLLAQARITHTQNVGSGVFGADMQINLTNDGPVTFWLQT